MPIGIFFVAIAIICEIYLRVTLLPAGAPRDKWPTEGYYFAGAQYQIFLQSLRLELWRHQQLPPGEQRLRSERDAKVLREVLHAKYAILTDSPEIRPFLDKVEGFREALPLLSELEPRLNAMVEDALRDPKGPSHFDDQTAELDRAVVRMVNNLRTEELSAFEAAFEGQRQDAIHNQELGLALLGILGFGLIFHVAMRRKGLAALRLEAESRAEAQRSALARVALLGMVSHELRTPLQTMMGDVEMLTLTATEEDARAAVASLERSFALLSGRLDNIAQYTRLASNAVHVCGETFALIPTLQRIVEEHRSSAGPGRDIRLVTPLTIQDKVTADQVRLHQILSNFLSNAIKYGGPGPITISAKFMETSGDAARPMCDIEVADDGADIPSSELGAIWEPFVRGRRAATPRSGSGLGLAVVRLLAESANWDVGVSSRAPLGKAFFVRFPIAPPHVTATSRAE
ncbi:HAMP domain-containing sensor histidine kinase [Variovorax sp. dw_954]|uniref:sensor histidine kinase n=1 Tax=Variovorax sp. dw_954 TaxID=2720078 RepID=UPI001BD60B2B|nr:HAMP domain-containing sensor histidine kinase [Variovorax sp. dw_954]